MAPGFPMTHLLSVCPSCSTKHCHMTLAGTPLNVQQKKIFMPLLNCVLNLGEYILGNTGKLQGVSFPKGTLLSDIRSLHVTFAFASSGCSELLLAGLNKRHVASWKTSDNLKTEQHLEKMMMKTDPSQRHLITIFMLTLYSSALFKLFSCFEKHKYLRCFLLR